MEGNDFITESFFLIEEFDGDGMDVYKKYRIVNRYSEMRLNHPYSDT